MPPSVPSSETTTATAGTTVARSERRKTLTTSDDEQRCDHQRDFDLAQRRTDGGRAVCRDVNDDVGRQRGPQSRAAAPSPPSTVRMTLAPGCPADHDDHRGLAVEPPHRADVLWPVVYVRDVRQTHRRSVAPSDENRRGSPLRAGQVCCCRSARRDLWILEHTAWPVRVGRREHRANVLQTDAEACELRPHSDRSRTAGSAAPPSSTSPTPFTSSRRSCTTFTTVS